MTSDLFLVHTSHDWVVDVATKRVVRSSCAACSETTKDPIPRLLLAPSDFLPVPGI